MPKRASAASPSLGRKTVIGVLASRDAREPSFALAALFRYYFHGKSRETIEKFHFVFTGGTHDRLFLGDPELGLPALDAGVAAWLSTSCGVTRLPSAAEGGVTILSCLITQHHLSIVWPFFSPSENHWLRPENLAFLRLCDQWHVKRLMNRGSVMVWVDHEADQDANRNLQTFPLTLNFDDDQSPPDRRKPGKLRPGSIILARGLQKDRTPAGRTSPEKPDWVEESKALGEMTIALIAHDEMKARMIDFAVDHDNELMKFGRIISTQTTGREVAAATSRRIDSKIVRRHSGPKGGDIEIATEVLYGRCDVVMFFVDPLHPHPHIDDIRVVFQACMLKDQVVMITNEMHAREFMSRVIRGRDRLTFYPARPLAG